jgi:hypothetical protein
MFSFSLQLTSATFPSQPDQLRKQGHFASLMPTGQAPGAFVPVLSCSQILFRGAALLWSTGTVAACFATRRRNEIHIPELSVAVWKSSPIVEPAGVCSSIDLFDVLCFCIFVIIKNLLCYTLQVYEQARTTVEYQRGVMQRGTMMK